MNGSNSKRNGVCGRIPYVIKRGAMAAGVQLLLQEAGVDDEQVEKVFLAGGVGQYLDAGNAAGIGLMPNAWVDRVIKVGNGSGLGAQIYMLNRHCHECTASLPKTMQYVEPSTCTRQNRAAASITAGLFFLCGNKNRIRRIQNMAKTQKKPSSQQSHACYWASPGSAKLARDSGRCQPGICKAQGIDASESRPHYAAKYCF